MRSAKKVSPFSVHMPQKCCIKPALILTTVAIVIWIYFLFLTHVIGNPISNDPFNRLVFQQKIFNESCCSWWPISHFILFFILGYLYPQCAVTILSMGIIWEGIEISASYFQRQQYQAIKTETGDVEYTGNWWAGGIKDILFNTAGFYTGVLVRTTQCKLF